MTGNGEGASVSGAVWRPALNGGSIAADGIKDHTGMPIALAMVLAGRGITKADVDAWLEPKIRDLMPDPSVLTDMDKAAARLADAVKKGEKIGIFGDYDVDGAASAAVLYDVLAPLGCSISIHIPDRFSEGYGPNLPALMKLKEQGCSLIVTVDCGITAHAPIAAAIAAGVDVIIIDHHIAGPELPNALAVVNPNRLEDDGTYGYLAAAGVCFLVMVALVRRLRQSGHFKAQSEPNLMASMDLVALATVCDVVPMLGLNRGFVRTGLKVMAQRNRIGLARLADIARMTAPPDVHALGFMLGPRINAGGRIGASSLGVGLLITRDKDEAARLAAELDALNTRRKDIEKNVTDAAIAQLEGRKIQPVMIAVDEGWNQGVIGITAGRVKDHFSRPSAVISVTKTEDGHLLGKASARSIAPFRLGGAVIAAQQHGLLIAGGGHDMAAGFTIAMEKLSAFQEFMNNRAMEDFDGDAPMLEHRVDAPLSAGAAAANFLDWMDRLGPFGTGFPEPRFALNDVSVNRIRTMGADGAHLAMRLADHSGQIDGVMFRAKGTAIGDALSAAADGQRINVLGRLNRNRYQGREKVQFLIEDVKY